MSERGQKFDKNKPRMSLLPKGALNAVIRVLEFGATKYQENNWKHVHDAKVRYYDAMQRHIDAWWQGEQKDPETGEHHLAHAICCGMFLWWFDGMDTKVMAGQGFAAKFVRKGDLEKIENCLHISTSMFYDDKAECFGCGAVVNHERKVIGVKRGASD